MGPGFKNQILKIKSDLYSVRAVVGLQKNLKSVQSSYIPCSPPPISPLLQLMNQC